MTAPSCPGCGDEGIATPVRVDGEPMPSNGVDGPEDANLWCPACGHGWIASADDYALALRAWRKYERETVAREKTEAEKSKAAREQRALAEHNARWGR